MTLLSGCAASGGREPVRFFISKAEAFPFFREAVATFNASQSDVIVTMDNTSSLQAGFVRGNPPDIALHSYNMEVARFLERGALSDLSDLPEAGRIRPEVQALVDQYATYPGRTSVLPFSVMAGAVIYNRRLFAEHGLAVPQTHSELLHVCEVFASAGITPFFGTFKDPWTIGQGWFDVTSGGLVDTNSFFNAVKAEGSAVERSSAVSFESTMTPVLEKMLELTRTFVNDDAAGRIYADGNAAMARGEAAMYLQGPWAFGPISVIDRDVELGTFPLPVTENPADLRVRVNLDLAAWIPEVSPHQQAARQFLSFLFEQQLLDRYNASQLGFGTTVEAAPPTDARIIEMAPYYQSGRIYQGASQQVPRTIPFENYLQSVVLGADPATVMRTVDADWARLARRQRPARQERS
ncbi:ABC transporter substrate-binding protein [Rathayibacter iranicus]|uniref:Raffinose/stachyose/melibiose transport system substrate-binding protein n=1 Tax=Rathayibacter iranicus NCPPB 2253 = VKM Ac-1602 TaxID=1328868 RepID=A0ABX5LHR8_9MICO|nr:extracellular solute-binding protein [Rathayibacter iranicus]PWJ66760.1 raffinose/stachyose/melibiose transport system substrate-binding protein [Rathayibacter iranicus NCPPB 2253 = VKM Ac-1602]